MSAQSERSATVDEGGRQPIRQRTYAGGLRRSAWGGWLVWIHSTDGDETGNTETEAAGSEAKARRLARSMARDAGWVAPRVEADGSTFCVTGYDSTPDLVYDPDVEEWRPVDPRYPRGVMSGSPSLPSATRHPRRPSRGWDSLVAMGTDWGALVVVGIIFGALSGLVAGTKGLSFATYFVLGFLLPVIGLVLALVAKAPTPSALERLTPATGAGWHSDPTGRFDRRYFDGKTWTRHVTRDAEQRQYEDVL